MKNLKKSAFSLIELSIVLLIIGILIAGVTQSSRLIRQMKLASARSLTNGAPVPSINGLSLWLETTGEKAFFKELDNEGEFDNNNVWFDRNPQTSQKADATMLEDSGYYYESCINDLPCFHFNGAAVLKVDKYLGKFQQGLSIFVVFRANDVPADPGYGIILSSTASTMTAGQGDFEIRVNADKVSYEGFDQSSTALSEEIMPGSQIAINNPYLISVIDKGDRVLKYAAGNGAINSTQSVVDTEVKDLEDSNLRIGSYSGVISEIIIFERALKTEEINSVHQYLAKKWGIKI